MNRTNIEKADLLKWAQNEISTLETTKQNSVSKCFIQYFKYCIEKRKFTDIEKFKNLKNKIKA